jgi:hypothetical protein
MGKNEEADYLALLEILENLLANGCRAVDVAEVKGTVPGLTGSEFDSSILRVKCLKLFKEL